MFKPRKKTKIIIILFFGQKRTKIINDENKKDEDSA